MTAKHILAHKIIYRGKEYTMSVATIENNRVTAIKPFERETASTVFISGNVRLDETPRCVKVTKLP